MTNVSSVSQVGFTDHICPVEHTNPRGFQPLSVRQTVVRGKSRGEERSLMDGVVQHLMLKCSQEHGSFWSLCALRWMHEAPPAAGTWGKQRRRSCFLSQLEEQEEAGLALGMRETRCLFPPFLLSWLYGVLWGQADFPSPFCSTTKGSRAPTGFWDPWEMWDGGGRGRGKEQEEKGVSPGPPSMRQIPAGWAHARALSLG